MRRFNRDQRFLKDSRVLRRIVDYAELKPDDVVLEIGAGTGNLTVLLSERCRKVIAYEKDRELASMIPKKENIEVRAEDFLKSDPPEFNKIVSNLPYSISSPVTFRMLELEFERAVLMYQKEFAMRMVAKPGTKDYSRLSANVQRFFEVELLEIVPRTAFFPRPKVDSAIVRLTPKKERDPVFLELTGKIFRYRRKSIMNNLRGTVICGIKGEEIG
ncbi:MAG: rRNA (adenine1518-N6/adenine1519-N6)-dimethyltransferase, partial [Archaeoglobi archaeon]|nr:rRNA (adenine1518-N6/adenine1519-N6)-dimethyltransferase [Archaeoglobi archaeon]